MKLLLSFLFVFFTVFSVGCKEETKFVAAGAKIQLHEEGDKKGLLDLTGEEALALLTSDEVLELVAEQYDFRDLWKVNRDEVVLRLRAATGVTVTSSLLSVSVSLETGELSRTVVNLIGKTFSEVVAENDLKARDQLRAILDAELEEGRDRYHEARKELMICVQQYGVPPMREELIGLMNSEQEGYVRTQGRRDQLEDRKEILQKRCGILKAIQQSEVTPLGEALLGSLEEELSAVQEDLDQQLEIVRGGGNQPVEPAMKWANFRELERELERAEVNLRAVEESQREERRRLGMAFRSAVVLSKAR